jgi:hypothetical protein
MMGLTGAAPRDGYSSQVASVQYPRASLYDGLPVDLLEATDELMSNRLAPSSMATVNMTTSPSSATGRRWRTSTAGL